MVDAKGVGIVIEWLGERWMVSCLRGRSVREARTNDEAREPSGPYAREHATRVPGAIARARP